MGHVKQDRDRSRTLSSRSIERNAMSFILLLAIRFRLRKDTRPNSIEPLVLLP